MEKFLVKNEKVFSFTESEKKKYFKKNFIEIIKHHIQKCKKYSRLLKKLNFKIENNLAIYQIPPVPVSIFKDNILYSCEKKKIVKKLLSSGTSGTKRSQIFLDPVNSIVQTKVLFQIMSHFFGKKRMPMLVIDKKHENETRDNLVASQAAVNGFSLLSKKIFYAYKSNGEVNFDDIKIFNDSFNKEKKIVFGFTDKVYNFFFENKNQLRYQKFNNCTLLHGGGWKKLESKSIDSKIFKTTLKKNYYFEKIVNYYGLIEQTGSIFVECDKCDAFKCSIYSDVFIRNKNFDIENKENKIGLLQLMSLLPSSYPGNNIITEDLGMICSNKICRCSFKGKLFRVLGRSKNSEVRGCANI